MACIVAAEIIVLGFFTLWPEQVNPEKNRDFDFTEDSISLDDVVMTRQQSRPPPPPKPQVPIPVPSDEIIEEEFVELENFNISEYSDSLSVAMVGSQGEADEPVTSPQVSPQIIHIVEPTVPEAAKKANIKAEIWVSFLVNKEGNVEEATIDQIRLHDQSTGEVRRIDTIDYGLTEATLNAALQWKFRPAKNNGEVVNAYTRQVFTFGF